MCTATNIKLNNTYFGRNLDLDYSFDAKVLIVPKNYEIKFKKEKSISSHYLIMGFGVINNHCPLFADAINEKGLAIAALNFPFNAKYYEYDAGKINLAPYELILYLLAKCSNILEVKLELLFINLLNEDFSNKVKLTPLHFLISDQRSSIVVESTSNGLEVFDNEYEILTNNPPFLIQKEYVSNYKFLSNDSFDPALTSKRSQQYFSFGSFAHGLPGDYSSSSRFIKANFLKQYIPYSNNETTNVKSIFNVLNAVSMPLGAVKTTNGYEYTRYSVCYNTTQKIIYYKTYENPNITRVKINEQCLSMTHLISLNLNKDFIL